MLLIVFPALSFALGALSGLQIDCTWVLEWQRRHVRALDVVEIAQFAAEVPIVQHDDSRVARESEYYI